MITQTTVKKRINQLVDQDNSDGKHFDAYYDAALLFIRDHLTQFYNHYAKENNLSIAETRSMVDKWGINQWKQAILQCDASNWGNNATDRVKAYTALAYQRRYQLMFALIGLGIVDMTSKIEKFTQQNLVRDISSQTKWLHSTMKLNFNQGNVQTIVNNSENSSDWSDRLWMKSDDLASDVQKLVNKHLRHGMALDDLNQTLSKHVNAKQFKPNQNISDRISVAEFNARRLVQTESSRVVNQVNLATFKQLGGKQVDVVNQPGACNKCASVADNGPYDISDVPDIPGDTHPFCRCFYVMVNLLNKVTS